jgi:hypothetical protein
MVSNRVLWPRRGQTHTEAVRVGEETPLTPHVLHIFRICGLDEPGTEEVGVLRGLAHETTAKMAIVPEATCGHIGQASDADPEGAASTICHSDRKEPEISEKTQKSAIEPKMAYNGPLWTLLEPPEKIEISEIWPLTEVGCRR